MNELPPLTLEAIRQYEQLPQQERFPLDTIPALLARAAERFAGDTAIEMLMTGERGEKPQSLSYGALFREVLKARQLLLQQGFRRGQVLSLLLPTLPEAQILAFAAQCGGIVNPLNPLLEVEHLAGILNATGSRVLAVCAATLAPEIWVGVPALLERCPGVEQLLVIGPSGRCVDIPERVQVLDYRARMDACLPEALVELPAADDVAAYFHTGGTTGRPKIAKLTQRNFAFVAEQMSGITGLPRHRLFNGLPLFHIYGAMVAGLASLANGNCVLHLTPRGFRNPLVLENFWHLVAAHRANTVPLVPTLFNLLLDADIDGLDLSCLVEIGSGAAPLPAGLKRRFERRFGLRIVEGYGMTESCCLISRCPGSSAPESHTAPVGSVGLRLPYTDLQVASLVDGGVFTSPNGEVGSILIRGPNVFAGYLDEADNRGAWHTDDKGHRWFDTGDCGYLDSDGRLTITGRAKDLIIRGGHNIDPQLIEEPLRRHRDIAEVVAVGMPDVRAGELPVVFVQPRPGAEPDAEALLQFAAEVIGERAAVPKRVFLLEQMPLTAVGKIFKPELRRLALQAAARERLRGAQLDACVTAIVEAGQLRLEVKVDSYWAAEVETLLGQFAVCLKMIEQTENT
ncbi:AMP-binding protein [Microbulbifer taiwanensis]|uniref:AMP-binding protein n=1 Tax=Microbulbifer taiwanensis TaxID=986746 RepID=A0ABW1YNS3_9GAMM|nr:AMP-binding protein [Microbulbifer taiwanensis]